MPPNRRCNWSPTEQGAASGAAALVTRGNEVELRSGARHKMTLRSSLRLD